MPRSIAILGVTAALLAPSCTTAPPAGTPPAGSAAAPDSSASSTEPAYVPPSGPPPPMYKPSSSSAEPMPITDPAYGHSTQAPDAPGLGATLPDFEVALADGGTFSLAQARGAGPVLIMFYRGFW